ncbi:hypothetical protein MIDIC_310038 [Alphaproteobacteria bacterium]
MLAFKGLLRDEIKGIIHVGGQDIWWTNGIKLNNNGEFGRVGI